MAEFIAYYRVSTDRQGASGLGLAAQREAVARYIGAGQPVVEYTEIESGKKHTNRPQLLAALADCQTRRAVLLIARLDRLARNVAFIANLMDGMSPDRLHGCGRFHVQNLSALPGTARVECPRHIPGCRRLP
jgi:DNA invertase Pin-like site-specific DNA recombinase